MGIQVLSARQYSHKLKITLQATGRLGFSEDTAKEFKLSSCQTYIKFLRDEDTDKMFLAVLYHPDEDAFKVCKSGSYYNLQTSQMFKDLGIDYKKNTVIYDLSRCAEHDEEFGGLAYEMEPRMKKRGKEK